MGLAVRISVEHPVHGSRQQCRQAAPRDPSVINKAIKAAAGRAGLVKKVSAPTLRHSIATHLWQRGNDIRTIQALLWHKDVSTTMIHTHALQQGGQGVPSPTDDLEI